MGVMAEQAPVELNGSAEKISFRERFGYGIGDLATNLIYASMASFLTFFYTDTVGISAGVIGTIMLLARVLDAVLDLVMGVAVDKTRSRHGKARSWILWTSVPFGLSAILLVTVPDIGYTGKIVYIIVTYLLMNIVFTASNIPYGTLVSLITRDPYERSVLAIFRNFLATIGSTTVGVVTLPMIAFFGNTQLAWIITFSIYGVVAIALFYWNFFHTRERVKPAASEQQTFKLSLWVQAVLQNKYWLMIFLFLLLQFTLLSLNQGVNVYYANYILGDPDYVGALTLALSIPSLLGLFIIAPVIKKIGKRNTALIGLGLSLGGTLIVFIDPTNVGLVIFATVVKGLGGAPVGATMFAFLADTIDYGEWVSGVRAEGVLFSAGSLGQKIGMGVGTALLGWFLSIGGYVGGAATQSAGALHMIQMIFIVMPAIIVVLEIIVMLLYKLDREYPTIMEQLAKGKMRGER
ncbi:MFS transporter [Paenibacillus sp. WLX1005]|uniref:MFS transporter n=1 Tax=Paenibacillus sp. WLX1005 TaxID=3243766 RepID=UPI0039840B31